MESNQSKGCMIDDSLQQLITDNVAFMQCAIEIAPYQYHTVRVQYLRDTNRNSLVTEDSRQDSPLLIFYVYWIQHIPEDFAVVL